MLKLGLTFLFAILLSNGEPPKSSEPKFYPAEMEISHPTDHIGPGGTFVGIHLPTTLQFQVILNSESDPNDYSKVKWDFGNGSFAYGHRQEYTYTKDGKYTVTAEFPIKKGGKKTLSATIKLQSIDCEHSQSDSESQCIFIEELNQHILPLSVTEWRLYYAPSANIEFSKLTNVYLHPDPDLPDEKDRKPINITDTASVKGKYIHISKATLIGKKFPLQGKYQIEVEGISTKQTEIHSTTHNFEFGSSQLAVTTKEANIYIRTNVGVHMDRLTIFAEHPGRHIIKDIPALPIQRPVSAIKDQQHFDANFIATPNATSEVTVKLIPISK